MQIVRTIVWVLLLAVLLIFAINNWNPVEVKIWEGLVLETRVPALVIVAFLLGLIPMWLLHRAQKWNLKRRIGSLEGAARAAALAPTPDENAASIPAPTPAHETHPVSAIATPDEPRPLL